MYKDVMVVQTGTANTASVFAGLERAGARPLLTVDPEAVADAERVVLPGVGALGATRERLDREGLVEVLQQRVAAGRPTLAICLGLQLLCVASEESPGVAGLGVLNAEVGRFPESVHVPQMGWNRIRPDAGCRFLKPGFAYFANSYRLSEAPTDWPAAWSEYGGPFVAALEKGDVLACQFHPELSGVWGRELMARWIEGAVAGETSC